MMYVISMFTAKPTAGQSGSDNVQPDYRKVIRESWNIWDIVATLGVVALCAAFYCYFW